MKSEINEDKIKRIREAILCVTIATLIGLGVYEIFLYFNIAIFGWNFGLIFAPLIAGYAETILARWRIGEDIGAISAFILFAYTTFYSFILKNSSLGLNFITIISLIIILQAAFPTLVNYLIITVGFGIILYIIGLFKKITRFIHRKIKSFIYKYILKREEEVEIAKEFEFDEQKSNEALNNLNFYFLTSDNNFNKRVINLGQFQSTVIIEKVKIESPSEIKEYEQETIYNLKNGKDECLIKLADKIKAAGGNGIINLDVQFGMIGLGGESYQVTALGMGVYIS